MGSSYLSLNQKSPHLKPDSLEFEFQPWGSPVINSGQVIEPLPVRFSMSVRDVTMPGFQLCCKDDLCSHAMRGTITKA